MRDLIRFIDENLPSEKKKGWSHNVKSVAKIRYLSYCLGHSGSVPTLTKKMANRIIRTISKNLDNGEKPTLAALWGLVATEFSPKMFNKNKRNIGFYRSREFLSSSAWRSIRLRVLVDHPHCLCCGAGASPESPLHVDHILPRSIYPELALEIWNLQTLCESCNLGKSNSIIKDFRPAPDGRIQDYLANAC